MMTSRVAAGACRHQRPNHTELGLLPSAAVFRLPARIPSDKLGSRRQPPSHRRGHLLAACASTPDVSGPDCSSAGSSSDSYDVVALNNLCVDIVLPVERLPSPDIHDRRRLLKDLTVSHPSRDVWEVGGSTNFLISAARLGMETASIGHVHHDEYGTFLEEVLREEQVRRVQKVVLPEPDGDPDDNLDSGTLLCFVLVDPEGGHAFCSRYDFGPWPLLPVEHLPDAALQLLRKTKAVYLNGFTFDELQPATVMEAVMEAEAHGSAVFFDPGPRCKTLLEGKRREAMEAVLDHTTAMLVTLEEGTAITGCSDAVSIAESLMTRPGSTRMEWVVVKDGGEGATLVTRDGGVVTSPGFTVDVEDTVGCGDSFAAAVVLGYIRRSDTDIATTLKLANAVGAATATRRGAGRNVGHPSTVEGLLQGEEGCDRAMRLLVSSRERSWAASEL